MTSNSLYSRGRKIGSVTLWGSLLNLVLMGMKIGIGLLIKSSALIADGIHSFSDLITDLVVLISAPIANRPADKTHPYGHGRIETIASQIIAFILLFVSYEIIRTSARSVFQKESNFPGVWILVIASVSVISKEIIFRITRRVAKETESPALYANAWHHRSDAFSSLAVLAGGIAGLFGWGYADHAAAIVVGIMIITVAGKILYEGLVELTETSACKESLHSIERVLAEDGSVVAWHALRSRKLGGELFVDLHILVNPRLTVLESHRISNRIEKRIKLEVPKPVNILIHIEPDPEIEKT